MAGKESTGSEWVYLHINAAFAKEGVLNPNTGKRFNVVTLPPGTTLGVKDVGGAQFFPYEFKVNKYDARLVDVALPPDKPVQLHATVFQRDDSGEFIRNEEGKRIPALDEAGNRQKDIIEVMPQALKSAIDKNYRDYKAEKAAERESFNNKTERAKEAASASKDKERPAARKQTRSKAKEH